MVRTAVLPVAANRVQLAARASSGRPAPAWLNMPAYMDRPRWSRL